MIITRRKARWMGVAATGGVVLLQSFNSFTCYHHDFRTFLLATSIFVFVPLLPALVSLVLPNPLPAVGACVLFAPWLLLAYHTDCVRHYSGGGASMTYVAVLLWGTASSFVGALITHLIANTLVLKSQIASPSSNTDAVYRSRSKPDMRAVRLITHRRGDT